ncbi:717_t:CDS:10, partial [Ambispora leptoticha]
FAAMEDFRHPLEERLKVDAEFSKTRLKAGSPTGSLQNRIDDLENKNFTLEEEVKDLRIQLTGRQNDLAKIQELLNKRTAEHEEKMKKMRGILNSAKKNVDDLRQTVTAKDAEIVELKESLEMLKEKDQQTKVTMDEIEKSASRLTTEMLSQAAMYTAQIEQLESRLRLANQQALEVKAEFQQYKQRAHALLQEKNANSNTSAQANNNSSSSSGIGNNSLSNSNIVSNAKTLELAESSKKMETEIRHQSAELKLANDKLRATTKDLERALSRNAELEKELRKSQLDALGNVEAVKEAQNSLRVAQTEIQNLKEELQTINTRHETAMLELRNQLVNSTNTIHNNLAKKQEENEELQRISENLSEELSQVRAQLLERTKELEGLQKQLDGKSNTFRSRNTAQSKDLMDNDVKLKDARLETGNNSQINSARTVLLEGRQHTTLSDLLVDVDNSKRLKDKAPITALSLDREKEFTFKLQHMAELLNESEAQVKRLEEQEKVLKEEIRKMDRLEKRQDLSVEYLKNVVLRFFETRPDDREPLIPVISTILQLSPEETRNLKENALNSVATNPVVLGFVQKDIQRVNRKIAQNPTVSKYVQEQYEQALSEDPTVFAYDEVYDNMKSAERRKAEILKGPEPEARKAKYVDKFLKAAEIRKRDLALAQERKIQKEREAEGNEFEDKETFVTSAYKAQAEELKKLEEEDKKKETEQKKGKHMTSFYRQLLDQTDSAKTEAIKASRASLTTKQSIEEDTNTLSQKSDKELAELALAAGKEVILNADEKIVDKRQLLSAGLNIPQKKKTPEAQADHGTNNINRYSRYSSGRGGPSYDREEIKHRERQSRELERQILETQRKAEEEQKAKDEQLIQKLSQKKDEKAISDARERYMARKKQRKDS